MHYNIIFTIIILYNENLLSLTFKHSLFRFSVSPKFYSNLIFWKTSVVGTCGGDVICFI